MNDPELVNRAMQLLGLKDQIVETLGWMLKHFDFERQNIEWGNESDEIKAAKELLDNIKKIGK